MSTINLTNAPFIQNNFIVTQAFSTDHHALDLAPFNGSQPLYAIDDFTVIYRYDYVEGGVANDRVVDTIHLYIAGLMDLKSTLKELSKHQPNNQMCLLNQSITDKYLVYDGTEELW